MSVSPTTTTTRFLTSNGFATTASSFEAECSTRNVKVVQVQIEPRPPAVTNNLKKRLLQALDRNEKARFFRIFNEAIPPSEVAANLEFQAQIYFATAPLRRNPPDKAAFRNEIDDLKVYLEDGPGAAMASDTELLPYFALPYVNDPVKHPVFRKLLS
uniref:ATP synthase-coupling factor 6, mitochondrial n=1 Tax=Panagrellus redivivus TaxID=6233 RepID=A0A7E4UTE4_PANRE